MGDRSTKRICTTDKEKGTFIFVHRHQQVLNMWCKFCTADDITTLACTNRSYAVTLVGFVHKCKPEQRPIKLEHWDYLYRAHFVNIPPETAGMVYERPLTPVSKYRIALRNIKANWRPVQHSENNKVIIFDPDIDMPYTMERALDIAIAIQICSIHGPGECTFEELWCRLSPFEITRTFNMIWKRNIKFGTLLPMIKKSARIRLTNQPAQMVSSFGMNVAVAIPNENAAHPNGGQHTVYLSHKQPRILIGNRFHFLFL